MSKKLGAMFDRLFRTLGHERRADHAAALAASDIAQRVAQMKAEDIRRQLANPSEQLQPHEEMQQTAYWQLWRSIRSPHLSTIPPAIFDGYVPEHVSLAMTVVGDFDAIRENLDSSSDSLYRPVESLPYPKDVIRRCCEFLIQLADSAARSFNSDFEMLANERDSLGLALFSLDYFVDSPLKEESRAVEKPQTGDVIARRGTEEPDEIDQVIGVAANNEWMVLTKSGASIQVTRTNLRNVWEEVAEVAPAKASWLTLTPPHGAQYGVTEY
ncbi:MAG TPA: hypothetical protein VNC11_01360 [Gemmatimonadaceae bacterium]|jgi:hypothetical protein|nr:hypothetical protein [Gemmatimonadaceae bacterium]